MLAWHFLMGEWPGKTRYGQITPPKDNVKWKLDNPDEVSPCDYGLHASDLILDALRYHDSTNGVLCRVKLSGIVFSHTSNKYTEPTIDKYVASERTILWRVPISDYTMRCILRAVLVPEVRKILRLNQSYYDIYRALGYGGKYIRVMDNLVNDRTITHFSDLGDVYFGYNRKTRRRLNDFIIKHIVGDLRV